MSDFVGISWRGKYFSQQPDSDSNRKIPFIAEIRTSVLDGVETVALYYNLDFFHLYFHFYTEYEGEICVRPDSRHSRGRFIPDCSVGIREFPGSDYNKIRHIRQLRSAASVFTMASDKLAYCFIRRRSVICTSKC